jgi:hypothetical protein
MDLILAIKVNEDIITCNIRSRGMIFLKIDTKNFISEIES